MKNALTIAGSDSCGGAGIQADLKTFSALGVFGMSVITAVTAQNTHGVFAVQDIEESMIAKQIEAIFEDIEVAAVKIGMVSKIPTIKIISRYMTKYAPQYLVLDPVMVSKNGYHLLKADAEASLIRELLPLATIVTPNIPEAEVIANMSICTLQHMEEAAKAIFAKGPKNVLVKGGHLEGDSIDILYNGEEFAYFTSPRIDTKNTHGTGCTLSAAIAANLACGGTICQAVARSKEYVTTAIRHSFSIGSGVGPVHHFAELYRKAGLTP